MYLYRVIFIDLILLAVAAMNFGGGEGDRLRRGTSLLPWLLLLSQYFVVVVVDDD